MQKCPTCHAAVSDQELAGADPACPECGAAITKANSLPATLEAPSIPGFAISRAIGGGGMGDVWEAVQLSLGRKVAIKALAPHLTSTPHFVSRFENEARAMARLSHPHIVSVIDFHTGPQGCFLIMEYVEGPEGSPQELKDLISAGKLDSRIIRKLVLQIAAALSYAHAKGIVHRDVKPSNVLLDGQGNAKVADFGIAALLDPGDRRRLTIEHSQMGTPAYMSPEQRLNAKQADARSDVYSLGVMIYEMLTGRLPEGRFAPASQCVPGLDPQWDQVIDRALQPDPAERFATMEQLAQAIETVHLEAAPVATPRSPISDRPSTASLPDHVCFHCRAAVPPQSQHCPSCGTSLRVSCPRCKAVSVGGAKFCPGCGVDMGKARQFDEYMQRGRDHFARAEDEQLLLADRLNELQQANVSFARATKQITPGKEELAVIDRAKKLTARLAIEAADLAWKDLDYRSVQEYCQLAMDADPLSAAAKQRLRELGRYRERTLAEARSLLGERKFDQAKAALAKLLKAFGPEAEVVALQAEIESEQSKTKEALRRVQELRDQKRLVELRTYLKQLQRDGIHVPGSAQFLPALEGTLQQMEIALADARSLDEQGHSEQALQMLRRIIVQVTDLPEAAALAQEITRRPPPRPVSSLPTIAVALLLMAGVGWAAFLTRDRWLPDNQPTTTAEASTSPVDDKPTVDQAQSEQSVQPVQAEASNSGTKTTAGISKSPDGDRAKSAPAPTVPTTDASTAREPVKEAKKSTPVIESRPVASSIAEKPAAEKAAATVLEHVQVEFTAPLPNELLVKVDGQEVQFERTAASAIKVPVAGGAGLRTFDISDRGSGARIYTKWPVAAAGQSTLPALTLVQPQHTQNAPAHNDDVTDVCIADDGQIFMSSQQHGKYALVGWSVTGADKLQWQAREYDASSPLALSSDGRLAAVWLRQRGEPKPALRVFNVADARPAWDMLGDSNFQPVVVRIKPGSGDTLATIDSKGRIHAWQRAIASQINAIPLKGSEKLVLESSGDGRHLLVGVGSQPLIIHRYEFRSQSQAPHQYDGAVGRLLAVGGSSVTNRVVAVTGGDQRSDEAAIFTWKFDDIRNPTPFVTQERATCAAVSVDGRYVAFGHFDGQVSVYDVDRQEAIVRFHAHDKAYGRVECLAMTPDGRFAVSGGRDALVFRYRLPILVWPQQ